MKKLTLLSILLCLPALAEYRVYQYLVQPSNNYPTKAQSFIATSTLDPVSYKSYHGGSLSKIDMVRTWLCPGYTGDNRPACEGPTEQASAETTGASNENR